ncbi:hypothetical protein BD769DRAFT_435912 [Suillus cothurnatus]|nr:hypothetical protein BD769DRAFT_435912 [Suillus cothurnatus]
MFSTLIVGSFIGYFANIYQEKLYQKHYLRKRQEARLYLPCVAGLFLPIGIFIYAWTARPEIPWIVPAIGLTIFMSGGFVIYMVVFCISQIAMGHMHHQPLQAKACVEIWPHQSFLFSRHNCFLA